jgi:4,5-dihydroxyphthalate decarboxylase
MAVSLSFACGLYDRTLPLAMRDVVPEGIDLACQIIDDPRIVFDRMAKGEFDVSEMSSSEFVSMQAAAGNPLVAIPVFVARVFRHSYIYINTRSGIAKPKDLEGKRIGLSGYAQTASVFIRGLLQHDEGVDLSRVQWIQGQMNRPAPLPPLPKLARPIPIESNRSGRALSDMLADGEIDAVLGAVVPESFGKSSNVARLYPAYREAEMAFYRRTRIFPIMHLIAIRRAVYEQNPQIAASLYRAFCQAKDIAIARLRHPGGHATMLPWLREEVRDLDDLFGGDPWPYGVEPNRPTLEALVGYMYEQGLIAAKLRIEDLFVPVT